MQDKMGKSTRKAITFPNTDDVIVEKGETIGNQHLSAVQQVVKDRLSDLEAELKDQRQRE
ncbi:MAG: hypothetical protein GWN61_08725, partial [candidate division Zixibacteria bacterium]|nr:hypothetical protein [candidate division Zixibacteria bacterium]NIS46081.1 hypothetical protein [candidate division Zixibacteria bacterium]NIV06254.1 hypothetical protein [candidate division Zixibacteria bacterium]